MNLTGIYKKLLAVIMSLSACWLMAQKKDPRLFTLMNERQTGLSFINTITENDSLNVLKYEYLYNGAGVGTGDFNKDGLTDIFFSGNLTPNKLFLNTGNFRFKDITRQSAVQGNGTWSTGVSIADVNGDGWPDIYVCHSGKYEDPKKLSNELFINQGLSNGMPSFKEMATAYGLDAPGTQSTQAAFFDYDLDGDLDMFLLNHSNHTYNPLLNTRKIRSTPHLYFGNRLFRNDKNTAGEMIFKDVTAEAGIINHALNYGLSVTISDVDQDGWPDIYTTSDYSEKDCFYVNNKNGTFTESVEKSFAHISKYSMGADIADYNNDGRPDIFTLDMLPEDNHRQKLLKGPDEYDQYHLLLDSGYYHQQMRNMLQLNQGKDQQGNTRFSEIGQLAGVSNTDWSWAGLFADFDQDGWKDLFVSNGYLRDYTNLDFLKYTVADAKIAAAKQGHQNFQTYDLVNKMPANKLSSYIFKNNRDLGFSNRTREWGLYKPAVSNAAAYADLDNDGDLDLIVCSNNQPVSLYRNNLNESNARHYLTLRLSGNGGNTGAYGAKVVLTTTDGLTQWLELYPVRGYQSSCTQDLLFGFSAAQSIQQLKVIWPGGNETIMQDVKPDQLVKLYEKDATPSTSSHLNKKKKLFTDISATAGISFIHRENDFIDFKQEVLLPYQLSRQGPALAKADVNGDGLEDLFLGGAISQPGTIYLQTATGNFTEAKQHAFTADAESEDVNALFFDADMDKDNDLYVVSGGNEYGDGSPEYQDRIYINDGKGNFEKSKDALPVMTSNKQAIACADIDLDGDIDLFVGGRGLPGSFPLHSKSYLLRNDSKQGTIRFSDITDDAGGGLRSPGMVTVASWVDLNSDKFPELLIGGDWMPLMLFENKSGKLVNTSEKAGLLKTSGMWSAMLPADVDDDGDIDFILGNCGLNNPFKASPSAPMAIYAADFDDNGSIDPLVTYYVQGKSYPMASRDELLDQIPALRKKFIKYADYADAGIPDIFSKEKINSALLFKCEQLASGILLNKGNNEFVFNAFPMQAQFSRVNAIQWKDFDDDGKPDILLAGNFFPYRVQSGSSDAGLGVLLQGKGKGLFEPVDSFVAGCYIDGDTRNMIYLDNISGPVLIIGKNNAAVQVLKVNR